MVFSTGQGTSGNGRQTQRLDPSWPVAGALEQGRGYRDGRLGLTADGWAQGWAEVFPELTEDERRLRELSGFTGAQQEAFVLADPVLNGGLPAHTGHAPEGDLVGNVISTPISGAEEQNIVEARPQRDFTTPSGNIIREHGPLTGEEYMLLKGHVSETIDDIIQSQIGNYPSKRGDSSTGGKQSATVILGKSGDWIMVNDVTGKIFQVNGKHNRHQKIPE